MNFSVPVNQRMASFQILFQDIIILGLFFFFQKHTMTLRYLSRDFSGDVPRNTCKELRMSVFIKGKVELWKVTIEVLANTYTMWSPKSGGTLQNCPKLMQNGWVFSSYAVHSLQSSSANAIPIERCSYKLSVATTLGSWWNECFHLNGAYGWHTIPSTPETPLKALNSDRKLYRWL